LEGLSPSGEGHGFRERKIWMNGKLVDWADARIHASHAVHYGSGVFDSAWVPRR
jgi:branched-subunit amino acid aminotransferase/4-amino-4-deoxychorismate lyase